MFLFLFLFLGNIHGKFTGTLLFLGNIQAHFFVEATLHHGLVFLFVGNTWGTSREHLGNIWGTFGEHLGNI
jgi:hypothetical protein